MKTGENVSEVDSRHEDYRWIVADWEYPAASTHTYVTADIDWSNNPADGWNSLDTARPFAPYGPRAFIHNPPTSADIRGIPLTPDVLRPDGRANPFYIRIQGVTADGQRSEWSQAREIPRTAYFYQAGGHQHDHSVVYSVSGLGSGYTDTIIADASHLAARIWNSGNVVRICEGQCNPGESDHVARIETEYTRGLFDSRINVFGNIKCGVSVACVHYTGIHLGHHLGNMTVWFEDPPVYGRGTMGDPFRHRLWTDMARYHGKWTGNLSNLDEKWKYATPTAIHELGHLLGLPDFKPHKPHAGIMKSSNTYSTVQTADWILLRNMYKHHVENQGW